MRKWLLLILIALLCGGCAWMDGSYVSVTPHQIDLNQASAESSAISSYSDLRNALTDLIDAGAEGGLFTLADYPQDQITSDAEAAVHYALHAYPIGSYAVETIDCEYGTGGGQNVLSVDITYRHSKSEIDQIRTVRGIDGAKDAIATALGNCQDSLLLLQITGYQETDFVQYIADYAAQNPDVVMELPQTSAQLYPDQGSTRVLELQFTYQTSRDSLRYMQTQVRPVFSSAALYVSGESNDATKFSQLYTFLMERFDYTVQTSITPTYSLLSHGVGDSRAFAQVYAAMCRRAGLEALWVSGTRDGESHYWNIVQLDGVYYHVDLLRCAAQGQYEMRTNEQMDGYVWDYSAAPWGEVE